MPRIGWAFRVGLIGVLMLGWMVPPLFAAEGSEGGLEACKPLEEQPVKVEGWISKKFRKDKRKIIEELGRLGHTRVRVRIFPMGDTAKVMAIGRCVPAPIARHVLQMALKYTGGVEQLVHQAFYAPHWIGLGTTMFDEPSQQHVNAEQVEQLLNPELSTEEFHALYQKFSIQDEKVPYFGMMVPNAKQVQEEEE